MNISSTLATRKGKAGQKVIHISGLKLTISEVVLDDGRKYMQISQKKEALREFTES